MGASCRVRLRDGFDALLDAFHRRLTQAIFGKQGARQLREATLAAWTAPNGSAVTSLQERLVTC